MTDILFPPWLRVSSQRVDAVSNTAAAQSIFTGSSRTVQRAGDRLRFSISTASASNNNGNIERAKLMAIRAKLRGQANRLWYSPAGYSPRGSFPATELLTNNTFANGTTGWSTALTDTTITVNDRVLRGTCKLNDGTNADVFAPISSSSVVQYLPYVIRYYLTNIGSPMTGFYIRDYAAASTLKTGILTSGMQQITSIPSITTMRPGVLYAAGQSAIAGTFIETQFSSLTQCALIDNSPNLLTYSDQFDNAAWSTVALSSTVANATTAPDGTTTADQIVEDSSTNTHGKYMQKSCSSSTVLDYCCTIVAKANTRTKLLVRMDETLGSSQATCVFDLSAGTAGLTATGANWSNCRAFIVSLGNGWYRCSIVAKKTNAATALNAVFFMCNSSGISTYAGDGASSLYIWRAGLAQSSVPFNPAQTTSAASSGTSQTGNVINVKGLPASTNGLLLESDYVQIGQQLVPVAAALNSTADGLGTLQLAWPLRNAPADNDPVIINTPMGKFMLTENTGGWDESPGIFSNHDFVIEEALDT